MAPSSGQDPTPKRQLRSALHFLARPKQYPQSKPCALTGPGRRRLHKPARQPGAWIEWMPEHHRAARARRCRVGGTLGLHPGGIEASRSIADSIAREGDSRPALTHAKAYRGFA